MIKKLLKRIDYLIELLLEEREYHRQQKLEVAEKEKETMLIEYARKHNKRHPEPIMSNKNVDDKFVTNGTDLIPYEISEIEREILREFYRKR
jgi:hypothetical protein